MQIVSFPFIFGYFAWLVLSSTAGFASDFHSPRTAALGGAGHAGPMLNDSIYLNPSFASFLPTYSISVAGAYFRGPATEPDGSSVFRGKHLNASVQDGRSEMFQAGVGFTRTGASDQIHVGASRSFVKRFGFGLGGKIILPKDGSSAIRDTNFSMTAIASDWFQAVLIVDNLFESGADQGLHREWILGTKFNIKGIVLIYFDPHLVPSLNPGATYGHETGIEFAMMADLFLRLGAFRNAWVPVQGERSQGYSVGLGWIGPRMSLDWGMMRALSPTFATSNVFGLTLYF